MQGFSLYLNKQVAAYGKSSFKCFLSEGKVILAFKPAGALEGNSFQTSSITTLRQHLYALFYFNSRRLSLLSCSRELRYPVWPISSSHGLIQVAPSSSSPFSSAHLPFFPSPTSDPIRLQQVSAAYARHSERRPAEIIPQRRLTSPHSHPSSSPFHNVQFILNGVEL